jgi:hypothetical protein
VDGWTVFFLVVVAAWVVTCLALAIRFRRSATGLPLRSMWLTEAVAFTALFGLVWLANPAMTFGIVSFLVPDAGFAAFALWFLAGVGRDGPRFGWAVAAVVFTWGFLVVGMALGHSDKQKDTTDKDRDRALLGQKVDQAHHHVPVKWVDRRPTVADAGISGATGERIERSVFGPGTLTMVVSADASCTPALVLVDDEGTTLDVMVVFQRSPFLSPLPSTPAAAEGGLCRPAVPGDFTGSGYRSATEAVQIDLPSTTTATAVHDASQP